MAPAKTPEPIVDRLYAVDRAGVTTAPDMTEQFRAQGVEGLTFRASPEAFTSFLRKWISSDGARWRRNRGARAD